MNRLFLLAFCLVCLNSCNFFGYRSSPHEKYKRSLSGTDFSDESIEKWSLLGEQVINDELLIEVPLRLSGRSNKDQIEAWSYRLEAPAGIILKIDLKHNVLPNQVFLDIFSMENPEKPEYLKSMEEGEELVFELLEPETYQIRIQAALGLDFEFEIDFIAEPIYEIFPVKGKGNASIMSVWGDPRDGGKRKHEGIDIFAKNGTPLLAVCDGEIDKVANGGLGGKTIWLYDFKNEQSIYYAHCEEQWVEEGQRVKAGEEIGTVGNTGNARFTPAHLHLGIYPDYMGAIDPINFVKRQDDIPPSIRANKSLLGKEAKLSAPSKLLKSLSKDDWNTLTLTPSTNFRVIGAVEDLYHIRMEKGETGFLKSNLVR